MYEENLFDLAYSGFKAEMRTVWEFLKALFNQYCEDTSYEHNQESLKNMINKMQDFMSRCPNGVSAQEFYNTLDENEKTELTECRLRIGQPIFVPASLASKFQASCAAEGIASEVLIIDNNEDFQKKMLETYSGLDAKYVHDHTFRAVVTRDVDRERVQAMIMKINRDPSSDLCNKVVSDLARKTNITETRIKEGSGRVTEYEFMDTFGNEKQVPIGGIDDNGKPFGLTYAETEMLHDLCARNKISFYQKKIDKDKYMIVTNASKAAQVHGFVDEVVMLSGGSLGKGVGMSYEEMFSKKAEINNILDNCRETKTYIITNRDRRDCIKLEISPSGSTATYYGVDKDGKPVEPNKGSFTCPGFPNGNLSFKKQVELWGADMGFHKVAVVTPEEFKEGAGRFDEIFKSRNKGVGFGYNNEDTINTIYEEEKIHTATKQFFAELYNNKNYTRMAEALKSLIGTSFRKSMYKNMKEHFGEVKAVAEEAKKGMRSDNPLNLEIPETQGELDHYIDHEDKVLKEQLDNFFNNSELGNGNAEIRKSLENLFAVDDSASLSADGSMDAKSSLEGVASKTGNNYRTMFVAAQAMSKACDRIAEINRLDDKRRDLKDINKTLEQAKASRVKEMEEKAPDPTAR